MDVNGLAYQTFTILTKIQGGAIMNDPVTIDAIGFQNAWAQAINKLHDNDWALWDLVVRIKNPSYMDKNIHDVVESFAIANNRVPPNKVAYTIFPYKLACDNRSFLRICDGYLTKFYPMTRRMQKSGWGTYFHRMICYPTVKDGCIVYVNQLNKILEAKKNSKSVMKTAYTMVLCRPGGENVKPLGTPCLNTVAVRQEPLNGRRSVIGNVSLRECWIDSPYLSAVRGILDTEPVGNCRTCKRIGTCNTGCLAQKYLAYGKLERCPDPACIMN